MDVENWSQFSILESISPSIAFSRKDGVKCCVSIKKLLNRVCITLYDNVKWSSWMIMSPIYATLWDMFRLYIADDIPYIVNITMGNAKYALADLQYSNNFNDGEFELLYECINSQSSVQGLITKYGILSMPDKEQSYQNYGIYKFDNMFVAVDRISTPGKWRIRDISIVNPIIVPTVETLLIPYRLERFKCIGNYTVLCNTSEKYTVALVLSNVNETSDEPKTIDVFNARSTSRGLTFTMRIGRNIIHYCTVVLNKQLHLFNITEAKIVPEFELIMMKDLVGRSALCDVDIKFQIFGTFYFDDRRKLYFKVTDSTDLFEITMGKIVMEGGFTFTFNVNAIRKGLLYNMYCVGNCYFISGIDRHCLPITVEIEIPTTHGATVKPAARDIDYD